MKLRSRYDERTSVSNTDGKGFYGGSPHSLADHKSLNGQVRAGDHAPAT